MLSVDKFPYPRKQTRGNEFIPCSNNICDILKCFRSFKITAITLIWPKSSYKDSVTRSYRSGKEKGRRSESPLWRHQWRSFVFIYHADDVKPIRSENQHEAWDKISYPCLSQLAGLLYGDSFIKESHQQQQRTWCNVVITQSMLFKLLPIYTPLFILMVKICGVIFDHIIMVLGGM